MKIGGFLTAGLLLAGMSGPSMAFESAAQDLLSKIRGTHSSDLIQKVSCDIKDDDKQARCMQGCDDEYIKASQAYSAAGKLEGPKEAKKACEAKCGC
jgi:hypothetical protein